MNVSLPKAILITQCLQNDFTRLLQKYDPLPNLLHVGYEEAKRLLGERAEEGPLDSVMEWAYSQSEEELEIIHIRDWHDDQDQEQKQHLDFFGAHCIQNSEGAEFVFKSKIRSNRKDTIINASGLNDFQNTGLEESLKKFQGCKIPVGIIGVWTEAKVFFLAYEIATRYPEFQICICSALCASSSRTMHFTTLDQMQKILGIKIYPSIGAFTSALTGTEPGISERKGNKTELQLEDGYPISETDKEILSYLFKDCRSAEFKCLDGGFSGNVVLKAIGMDVFGHHQVPTVVKIGERDPIAGERTSFERIQEILGNNAPSIVDFAEYKNRGAIKYRYAAMLEGNVRTFQKLFAQTEDLEKIKKILDIVFVGQLGRLYEAARLEKSNLLEYYDFNAKYSPGVRRRVEALLGKKADGDSLEIAPGIHVENVCNFYEKELPVLKEYNAVSHFMSYIHGDLNGANIIIDAQENVWIIDFFHTHIGHVLRDLIKLENDILYIFAKIETEEEFHQATCLSDFLYNWQDLGILFPEEPPSGVQLSSLKKAYYTIRKLRSFYPTLIQSDRDPYQLHVAVARYAMHTLAFDESNDWQRKWALYSGALAIGKIRSYIEKTKTLRIDFIRLKDGSESPIALTILPGRKDRARDLTEDLKTIKNFGISSIVCLLTEDEFTQYGVEGLKKAYEADGFSVMYSPLKDQTAPTLEIGKYIIQWVQKESKKGKKILIHCVGGLGRSGTIAACFLKQEYSLTPEDAIALVRESRSERAIEVKEQENFIFSFSE